MDTDLLEGFLEVAQRLHFGHSARHLQVTQPALSHQIRRLEHYVGTSLFDRTSRQVRLTPAGEALVPPARRLLADLERAVSQCRAVAAGGTEHLTIGSIGAALNSVTPRLVRALRDHLPGLRLHVLQMDTPVQTAALRAGEIDIGVVRSAGPAAGIGLEDLFREPMVLALPHAHPLAQRRSLSAADLASEAFITWPRATSPLFHDQVHNYCRTAGFQPTVVMEGNDIETQLGLVSEGIGISPQPASFANLRRAGVVFRGLASAPESVVQLAWSAAAPPPHIDHAIRLAHLQATPPAALTAQDPG